MRTRKRLYVLILMNLSSNSLHIRITHTLHFIRLRELHPSETDKTIREN